jgi:hypothetical protein
MTQTQNPEWVGPNTDEQAWAWHVAEAASPETAARVAKAWAEPYQDWS